MGIAVCYVLGIVGAVAATVLACIFIFPEKKAEKLNKFWSYVRKVINFDVLFLEKILKVLYVFCTAAVILIGFFMLFSWGIFTGWSGGTGILLMILGPIVVRLIYEGAMLFLILVRNSNEIKSKLGCKCDKEAPVLDGEFKNAAEPEVKVEPAPGVETEKKAEAEETPAATPEVKVEEAPAAAPEVKTEEAPAAEPEVKTEEAPAAEPEKEPHYMFCSQCGTKYDTNKGNCPNCGKK